MPQACSRQLQLETQEMKHPGSETGLQPMGLLTPEAEEDKKNDCLVCGATHPRNGRGKLVPLDMSPIMRTL